MMSTLLEYDLKDFEVRGFPDTPARQFQKFESLEPFEAWWIELLSMDEPEINGILLKQDEENSIHRRDMREEFDSYSKNINVKHRSWSPQKFGRHMHRLLPDVAEVRPLNQERHYRFPSLQQCRLHVFEEYPEMS